MDVFVVDDSLLLLHGDDVHGHPLLVFLPGDGLYVVLPPFYQNANIRPGIFCTPVLC